MDNCSASREVELSASPGGPDGLSSIIRDWLRLGPGKQNSLRDPLVR